MFSKSSMMRPLCAIRQFAPARTKVIIQSSHPHEYFHSSWDPSDKTKAAVHHPTPIAENTPLYYKITLHRSLIGLPWQKRYMAGVLFKKYAPHKSVRPKAIDPNINTHTTIFREASPEVAEMILDLKEVLKIENIWNEEQYRTTARELLGKYGKTAEELQQQRGYYVMRNLAKSNNVNADQNNTVTKTITNNSQLPQ